MIRVQLKEEQESLQKALEEAKVKNHELEQFAYVASHDLKEPLRMVTSFMELLQKRYKAGDSLDEKAMTFIHFAVDGGKRMQQLISDLLDFSRIGAKDAEKELTDLNKVIAEVRLNLMSQMDECNAVLTVEDTLPVLPGFRPELSRLFQNIISNAIKFRNGHVQPLITIRAAEAQSHWVFEISDNGIGIADHNYQKIFEIFGRLNSRENYSGTGMGLAISKKIVEKHGGKIWVESQLGAGSTFYFTISK